MFELLNFQPHLNGIPGAIGARHNFENGWEISVVSGPAGCGLYGNINKNTYEVAIIRPNGNMTEDVNGWNTKQEVSAMMWVLSQL
jgi:hypothetical protein